MTAPSPILIAVDGRSGAGKTTLALELAALLRGHRRVSVFHLEDIYPGWDGLAAGVERYVGRVLAPLSAGQDARWASWDWDNHFDGPMHTTPLADVVIVEGVGAAHASARPFLDVVVWVEAPDVDRKRRALARDGDTYAPFWEQWARQEEELLAADDVAAAADLVVAGLADDALPAQVMLALTTLPALEILCAPELARRRALELHTHRLEAFPDVPALFARLYGSSTNAVWLDSSNADAGGDASGQQHRFSILADDGGAFGQLARHTGGTTRVQAGPVTSRIDGPFFRWLDTVWGRRAVRAPKGYEGEFTLGWLGYLGYELKRETGGSNVTAEGAAPDAALLFAGRAVVVDHAERCLFVLSLGEAGNAAHAAETAGWLDTVAAACAAVSDAQAPAAAVVPVMADPPVFSIRDGETAYKESIAAAQTQIWEGNSYEICLTTGLHARTEEPVDAWAGYLALRRRNPAPFASFLRFGPLAIASTSPERFLRIDAAGLMRAEPIKGTRRRHPDPDKDAALKADLAGSLKDRAENIMIVDLLRNDLSHFAVPASLQVPRLCEIESYATVHQMVSTIEAQLRPGSSRAQAVAAAFPAGSMTGAPKISTMAILDTLESGPRGVYSGAVGYFSLNSATDLSVTIRTLVLEDDGNGGTHLGLGVGGAITADSSPHEEWMEIQAKAYGVLSTLGSAFPA
ncbi:aminodeoxychorismate synthase component I [Arthrobacter sp. 35W]|uniref:aminodeoxychorismate synthase component I n=1 Tax=Arthrobacter sp. 35W TaxID=1132441 RepID=UPI00040D6ED9|nr:aminodeoxychorismate synthase component I [Arthrobacter sp. 35W]